jgi:hypothetical protein
MQKIIVFLNKKDGINISERRFADILLRFIVVQGGRASCYFLS